MQPTLENLECPNQRNKEMKNYSSIEKPWRWQVNYTADDSKILFLVRDSPDRGDVKKTCLDKRTYYWMFNDEVERVEENNVGWNI